MKDLIRDINGLLKKLNYSKEDKKLIEIEIKDKLQELKHFKKM